MAASTLARARETAQLLREAWSVAAQPTPPLEFSDAIVERALGRFEGCVWAADIDVSAFESLAAMRTRCHAFVRDCVDAWLEPGASGFFDLGAPPTAPPPMPEPTPISRRTRAGRAAALA